MLKKICSCGKYINQTEKRCKDCELKYRSNKKESNRIYNSNNRDKETDEFYNSSEWIDKREYILNKYHYRDLWDYFINNDETKTANTVHHIVEIKDNDDLRLEEYNLFPTSPKNHIKIHKLYRKDRKGTQQKLIEIIKLAHKEFEIEYENDKEIKL